MYGWIVDGISSLFEPVTGQNHTEWPGKRRGNGEEARRQDSHGRPAKRNYKSVHVADNVCQSDPVEAKRRKRDVVISFVKKTVESLTGLLRLRKQLPARCENPRKHEETQSITLMGIDELHTSWLNGTDWKMDKSVGGVNDRSAKNPFQSSLPPLIRKYNGTTLPAGLPDRGKNWERRGSLQLLPSRPAVRVGTANPEPICNGYGNNRCYKPSLTVEEAIKQNNKEHYRRLLEMVTEKYSKSQPLPFNQAKPHDESQISPKTSALERTIDSVSRKVVCTAAPNVFTYRNTTATKDRWGGLTFNRSYNEPLEEKQPVRYTKQKDAAEVDLSTEVATRLNLVDREASPLRVSETQSAFALHLRQSDENIPRLTKEMAMEVSEALAQRDPNLVLSAAFKLRITQRDLSTLLEGGWLNDEVINFYLSLVVERRSGESGRLKVYAFSTFFYPKLRGGGAGGQAGGHAAVKRWTKAVDLFMFDLILIPLHLGAHWALAVIDLKTKTVKSYDSMGQRHDDICNLLLLYLKEEHKAKKGRELDSAKWTLGSLKDIPHQKNGSDCGVFACKYADYIAKEKPLTFNQCHMPLFRKLMMWEILNQKLL